MDAPPGLHRRTRSRGPAPVRRRLRLLGLGVALVTAAGLVPAAAPGRAAADPSTPGAAVSRAAQVDAGTLSVVPTLKLIGLNLSGLAGLVTTGLVNPLLALPNGITNALAASLVGSGLAAANPSSQQPRPATGSYPVCGQQGWTSSDCYGPVAPSVSAAPLVTLSTGAVQGYATGDDQGYIAGAHAADPVLSVLGIGLGDLGVVDSGATCTPSGTSCLATHALTGGSLFNNTLTYGIASGTLLAKIGNASIGTTPVTVINGVTATVGGNLLTLKISLGLTQLLAAIGTTLAALGTLLGGVLTDSGTTATLTVTIGPGDVTTGGGAQSSAWGLEVGMGLTADIELNLGVLATIGVAVKSANSSAADLADLKLAYSQTTAGTLLAGWVPPALI